MNQKYVFLQALIVTLIIFNIGIFLGYKLESSRINQINNWYLEADMELLDQRIQSDAFDIIDFDCNSLVKENINFADEIFEKAKVIQRYEDANKINSDIVLAHKRYDLLRTLFWINSMKIKEKCKSDYHDIVYFYQYNNVPLEKNAKQNVFSNFLSKIKEEQGEKVMLIPIAADNNLSAVNLLMEKYGIDELPVILIDEKTKLTDVQTLDEIRKYLN